MSSCDTLFIRMDKIGDLILSLPVDQYPQFINKNNHWFISKGLSFIPQNSPQQRSFTEFNKDKFSEISRMRKWLRENKPKVAVVFYAPWWVGLALFLEKVPVRIGRKSQWHSFLFFNKSLRQKRSLGEKHELEYNIEMLNVYFDDIKVWDKSIFLELKTNIKKQTLERFELSEKEYIIVHPGMAGSALNWPEEYYIQLCEQLIKKSKVVITGTKADGKYINPLRHFFGEKENIIFTDTLCSGEEFIALCEGAQTVVAPSTGAVHIAASCGTPTIGLYSPIPTQRATRWGAIGKKVVNIEAQASEPIEQSMNKISVDYVLDYIDKLSSESI